MIHRNKDDSLSIGLYLSCVTMIILAISATGCATKYEPQLLRISTKESTLRYVISYVSSPYLEEIEPFIRSYFRQILTDDPDAPFIDVTIDSHSDSTLGTKIKTMLCSGLIFGLISVERTATASAEIEVGLEGKTIRSFSATAVGKVSAPQWPNRLSRPVDDETRLYAQKVATASVLEQLVQSEAEIRQALDSIRPPSAPERIE